MADLFLCNRCGERRPFRLMVKAPTRSGVAPECLACRWARRKRSERPDGIGATNVLVDGAPDPGPAVRLRVELARLRADGRPFSAAWPRAVRLALADLPAADAASWRRTFSSTRRAWSRSYARAAWSDGRAMPVGADLLIAA